MTSHQHFITSQQTHNTQTTKEGNITRVHLVPQRQHSHKRQGIGLGKLKTGYIRWFECVRKMQQISSRY